MSGKSPWPQVNLYPQRGGGLFMQAFSSVCTSLEVLPSIKPQANTSFLSSLEINFDVLFCFMITHPSTFCLAKC